MSQFQLNLTEMIRARHPVLLVETQEPERVVHALEGILAAGVIPRGREIRAYTLTSGLHVPGGQAAKRVLPEEALLDAINVTEPSLFIFQDVHHQLGGNGRPAEPGLVRAILDVAAAFKSGPVPHTLLLIAPGLTLPVDLEKVVVTVQPVGDSRGVWWSTT